jgi:hypothetical protein
MFEQKNWYFIVNDYCNFLSLAYDVPLIKVAAIMSALSPNNKFDQNCKDLERFLLSGGLSKASTYQKQRDKAYTILHMENYCEDSIKNILGQGLKTRSFFENIYRPETSDAVTVDLWQIRWAKKLNIIPMEGTLTQKRYRKIAARVKKYAKKLDIMPHQFQAITWANLRGEVF